MADNQTPNLDGDRNKLKSPLSLAAQSVEIAAFLNTVAVTHASVRELRAIIAETAAERRQFIMAVEDCPAHGASLTAKALVEIECVFSACAFMLDAYDAALSAPDNSSIPRTLFVQAVQAKERLLQALAAEAVNQTEPKCATTH